MCGAVRRACQPIRIPLGSAGLLGVVGGVVALSCINIGYPCYRRWWYYPLTVVVAALLFLAAAETGQWHDLGVGAACAAGWFAIFYALFLIGPRMLGLGMLRLAVVLGLALGWLGVWYVLLGFFAANLIGALLGLVLITTGRMSRERHGFLTGCFLALGCAVAVFTGPELLAPLMHTSL